MSRLCSREVVAIDADASVHDAAALMCEEHVGALVVVTPDDPPKVVGLLTDRDLALDVLGRRGDAPAPTAGQIAKSPPVAIASGATIDEAVVLMEQAGVRRLLVVDDEGGVVGLVSADDLLVQIAEQARLLAQALRKGIAREARERGVAEVPRATRPVFQAGFAAMQ